jgi:hypothetical protein
MSLLRLDFEQNNRLPMRGFALLGVAIIVLAATFAYFLILTGQVESLESKTAQAQNRGSQRGGAGRLSYADPIREIGNANDVLRRLGVPWDSLFQAVESSAGRQVTLLGLEPDIERRQVKISGEARNFKAVMNYIMQLERQDVFGSVYLQSHEVQQQDPDKPVRFALLAAWKDTP